MKNWNIALFRFGQMEEGGRNKGKGIGGGWGASERGWGVRDGGQRGCLRVWKNDEEKDMKNQGQEVRGKRNGILRAEKVEK